MTRKQISKLYTSIALFSFNTVLLLLLINLGLYAFHLIEDLLTTANPVVAKYGIERLAAVYPHLNEKEIDDLLKETWSRPYAYEPFTQFKERSYDGQFVNVDESGFRISDNQGAWPPEPGSVSIFLFGGSTTFGYGAEDNQTVASHLQDYLRTKGDVDINIFNFGRGHYYSSQERILFEQLLSGGHVPDMAIFIDGLNDFFYSTDVPLFTKRFQQFVREGNSTRAFVSGFGVTRVLGRFAARLSGSPRKNEKRDDDSRYDDPVLITKVINRYIANKKLIESAASSHGVESVFVWQPVPTYGYDDRNHLFLGSGYGRHTYSRYGYKAMQEYITKNPLGANFLWSADIQRDLAEPLYVDKAHFTAAFSKRFASFIAEHLLENYASLFEEG
jgi:hypothetical protein